MHSSTLRHALRRLWKDRGFSLSVVLTLGLGIGATIAVFSIVYVLLICSLPYSDPERLVSIFQSNIPNDESGLNDFSPANFLDFRQQNQTLTDLGAYCGFHYNLTGNGEPKHLNGLAISASAFSILGIKPILGRPFLPQEDSYSSTHVVLLSHHVWSRDFQSDSRIVGRTISLNGDPYYVVGVMPPTFRSPDGEDRDLWIPLQQQIRPDRMLWRDLRFLGVIGKLRPGATLAQARADMNRIAVQLHLRYPHSEVISGAVVLPLQHAETRGMNRPLRLASGIVLLVLLIATSNAAILMLVRVAARKRELAVRTALGASTVRILSEVLAESLVLGFLSGVCGLMVVVICRQAFVALPSSNSTFALIEINPEVVTFAVLLSLLVGFGFGLVPALRLLKNDVYQVLRSAGNTVTLDSSGRFLRHTLVSTQICLSIVLLVATGLLLRSMFRLQQQQLGFRTSGVMTSWIGLPRIRYQNDRDVVGFFSRLDENLRSSPDVEAVGLGYPLPLEGNRFWTSFSVEGRTLPAGEYDSASLRFIDSGFLRVMGIPIVHGRNFADSDDADHAPVTIVSESFARKYWPVENPVGKYITIQRDTPVPRRVVGVVPDVRTDIETDPSPTMYVSFKQMSFPSMQVVLLRRGGSSAEAIMREAVRRVDPDQPVIGIEPMESVVQDALGPWRVALSLLGGLAALGVVLTAIGLFGVISFTVRERTKEFGVRVAMGASKGNIAGLILRQSAKLALVGMVSGLVLTFTIERVMKTMVYAIHPNDPMTIAFVVLFVSAISIVAACIPAMRAARIDPLTALREE